MFAPKIAKPEAKATARSTANPAHPRSALLARRPAVQEALLLRIGARGDRHEQEADRMARQVLAQPMDPRVGPTTPVQHRPQPATARMAAAPASVERALASPGHPLEPTLRQEMERRFAQDFSRVRVH